MSLSVDVSPTLGPLGSPRTHTPVGEEPLLDNYRRRVSVLKYVVRVSERSKGSRLPERGMRH